MISDLKGIFLDANLIDEHVRLQHEAAMLEDADTYGEI